MKELWGEKKNTNQAKQNKRNEEKEPEEETAVLAERSSKRV